MSPVIEVRQLRKRHGDTVAVDDISFAVAEGEIFGILGPNGAGKTTTAECIDGLRAADRGEVSVLGLDPRHQRAELTQRLDVQLQDSQLPAKLRVDEAPELYSSFYRNPARRAAGEPARCHPRHPQGRCRGGRGRQQRAQRGHLRAGPQPDRGRQLRVEQANLEDAFLALTGSEGKEH
jgi:ABC-type branched-subunit amino acid transport system ATPase component